MVAVVVVLVGVAAMVMWASRDAARSMEAEPVGGDAGQVVLGTPDSPAGSPGSAPVPTRALPTDAGRPTPMSASGRPITAEDLVGLTVAEQAAILGDTDLSNGLENMPPPLMPTGPAEPFPERPAADPDYILAQREAGLDLLDTTVERLGRQADEREQAGDATGAQRMRVRIARITALRARRAAEVETLRSGGVLPSTDPEDRARADGLMPPEEPRPSGP